MPLEIIQYPHPTLRHRSKPLRRVDAALKKMIAEMFDLMYEHEGVGLAANQVDLPYRLFVANPTGDPNEKEMEHVFINPVVTLGKGHEEGEEGCLSIPDLRAPVVRPAKIHVQAYGLAGDELDREIDGFFARVIQHETDHLDGTLFIDRVSPAHALEIRDSLYEFEADFESQRQLGGIPSDEAIAARIAELEALRT